METVQKNVEVILIFFGLFISIDATICGFFGIKTGDTSRMPKTIAYPLLKLLENGSKKFTGNDERLKNYLSTKTNSWHFFIGGILSIIIFLLCLVEVSFK